MNITEKEIKEYMEKEFLEEDFDIGENVEVYPNHKDAMRRRRKNDIKKKKRQMRLILSENCATRYIDYDFIDGHWQPVGRYIKYPKNSSAKKEFKRTTRRKNRREAISETSICQKGNHYKRADDWWHYD